MSIICIFFSHGLVGLRNRENSNDFKNPLIVAYYGVDYVKNAKGKVNYYFIVNWYY